MSETYTLPVSPESFTREISEEDRRSYAARVRVLIASAATLKGLEKLNADGGTSDFYSVLPPPRQLPNGIREDGLSRTERLAGDLMAEAARQGEPLTLAEELGRLPRDEKRGIFRLAIEGDEARGIPDISQYSKGRVAIVRQVGLGFFPGDPSSPPSPPRVEMLAAPVEVRKARFDHGALPERPVGVTPPPQLLLPDASRVEKARLQWPPAQPDLTSPEARAKREEREKLERQRHETIKIQNALNVVFGGQEIEARNGEKLAEKVDKAVSRYYRKNRRKKDPMAMRTCQTIKELRQLPDGRKRHPDNRLKRVKSALFGHNKTDNQPIALHKGDKGKGRRQRCLWQIGVNWTEYSRPQTTPSVTFKSRSPVQDTFEVPPVYDDVRRAGAPPAARSVNNAPQPASLPPLPLNLGHPVERPRVPAGGYRWLGD